MLPKTILLATDFSENSALARQYAMDFAQALGAELIILHVINFSAIGYPSLDRGVPIDVRAILTTIQTSADKSLKILAKECTERGIKGQPISCLGFPAQEIVKAAEEHSAGLIVMGTHGWTGFKRFILGSTAENVVRTSKCPVLTVRSQNDEL